LSSGFEENYELAASSFELLVVQFFVVGGRGFPELEQDVDPLVGQGADGGVVFAAYSALFLVEVAGPGVPLAGVAGELVEGLLEEFRAGAANRQAGACPTETEGS
jgi:hypothetical protein